MRLPLEGIRVVDATWVMAGPTATSVLADMGAEVIKVESIQVLDRWRAGDNPTGPGFWEHSGLWNTLNRNKLSITLNLADPRGADIFKRLVAVSDVVAENYTPRVMSNFGLGYEELHRINADIIMLSMPGYGMTGPWRDYVSFAPSFEEMSGIAQLQGYSDGPPHLCGRGIGDPLAGLHGTIAILTALAYRQRTGEGQYIDLSDTEACTNLIGHEIVRHQLTGELRARRGSRDPECAPQGVYPSDGEDAWIAISIRSDEEWARFVDAIGSPGWANNSTFDTAAGRMAQHDEIDARVAEWTRALPSREAMYRLQAHDIRAGAVLDARELLADEHLRARSFFDRLDRTPDGLHDYPSQPVRFDGQRLPTRRVAPTLGQDNDYVIRTVLGLKSAELTELYAANVVGTWPIGADPP